MLGRGGANEARKAGRRGRRETGSVRLAPCASLLKRARTPTRPACYRIGAHLGRDAAGRRVTARFPVAAHVRRPQPAVRSDQVLEVAIV